MRELKFRAYHKQSGLMLPMFQIDTFSEYVMVDKGDHTCEDEVHIWNFNEIEIMQSTGLKDKNGVEIFEGDYVVGDSADGVVDYSVRGTRFGIHSTKPHYITGKPISKYYSLIGCKVIGNIHENPELMDQPRA